MRSSPCSGTQCMRPFSPILSPTRKVAKAPIAEPAAARKGKSQTSSRWRAVVILTARHRELVWLFPFLAAAGSAMGAFATFLVGERIGEKGLMHWVPEHGLERIQKKIK